MSQLLAIGKHYYPRPTLASILFEENSINSALSFDSESIYEWNVDGKFEYQIITTLHNILMYSTIYRTANNNGRQITEFIIARFSGQLKGW